MGGGGCYSKCVHVRTNVQGLRRRGIEKSVIRRVRNKWMTPCQHLGSIAIKIQLQEIQQHNFTVNTSFAILKICKWLTKNYYCNTETYCDPKKTLLNTNVIG